MVERGYDLEFAERTFSQLEGFGSYGFPERHAASFALIAYASSWLKCHRPDVFCAALLNAQPMGFYAPAQIVRDAQAHGVEVRPVCVNASRWDCTLGRIGSTDRFAMRLGLRQVKGLANKDADAIVVARARHPSASVDDLWRRAGVPAASLVEISEADGFRHRWVWRGAKAYRPSRRCGMSPYRALCLGCDTWVRSRKRTFTTALELSFAATL